MAILKLSVPYSDELRPVRFKWNAAILNEFFYGRSYQAAEVALNDVGSLNFNVAAIKPSADQQGIYERVEGSDISARTTNRQKLNAARRLFEAGYCSTALEIIHTIPFEGPIVSELAPSLQEFYTTAPNITLTNGAKPSALCVGDDGKFYGLFHSIDIVQVNFTSPGSVHPQIDIGDPQEAAYLEFGAGGGGVINSYRAFVPREGVRGAMITVLELRFAEEQPPAPGDFPFAFSGGPIAITLSEVSPGAFTGIASLFVTLPNAVNLGITVQFTDAPEFGFNNQLTFTSNDSQYTVTDTGSGFTRNSSTSVTVNPIILSINNNGTPTEKPDEMLLVGGAKTLDARPLIAAGAGVPNNYVGYVLTGFEEVLFTIATFLGGIQQDNNTNLGANWWVSGGGYAVPNGVILWTLRVIEGPFWLTAQFGTVERTSTEQAYCARIVAQNNDTLKVVQTYPTIDVRSSHEESQFGTGASSFARSTYAPVVLHWKPKAYDGARSMLRYEQSEGIFDNFNQNGSISFALYHEDIGLLHLEPVDDQNNVFSGNLYYGDVVEAARGRIVITRTYPPNALRPYEWKCYVDGELVDTYTENPSGFFASDSPGILKINSSDGSESHTLRLNGVTTWWTVTGSQSNIQGGGVNGANLTTSDIVRKLRTFDQVPAHEIITDESNAINKKEMGGETIPGMLPMRRYYTSVAPELFEAAEEGGLRRDGILVVRANFGTCYFLSALLEDTDLATVHTAQEMFDAKETSGTLPDTIQHDLIGERWENFYTTLPFLLDDFTVSDEEKAEVQAFIDEFEGYEDDYASAKTALLAATTVENFAAIWNPIRDAVLGMWGKYHVVVYNDFAGETIIRHLGKTSWISGIGNQQSPAYKGNVIFSKIAWPDLYKDITPPTP